MDKGLKLYELAQKARMGESYLSRLERNRITEPKRATVEKLARALDVPLAELTDDEPTPRARPSLRRKHADDPRFARLAVQWDKLTEETREHLWRQFQLLERLAQAEGQPGT